MFVSDLLKNARSRLPSPVANKAADIYQRVWEEKQRLENEQLAVAARWKELAELRSECAGPWERCAIRAQSEKKRKLDELEEEIRHIESGKKLKEFTDRVQPYIYEYQKRQFCRQPSEHVSGSGRPPEQSNAVLEEYTANVEGAVAQLDLQETDARLDCKEAMHGGGERIDEKPKFPL
jgi:hypothetical protein